MNPDLIERFFRKQCTTEEARSVAAYLKANPHVLEQYLSKHEWDSLDENSSMPEEFWNTIWSNIQKENKAKIITIKLKNIATAACIILLAGTAYFYFNNPGGNKKPLIAVHKTNFPQLLHKTVSNTTNKLMTIVLEDSSVIKLSPASVVEYDVPFPDTKRDILLNGEAIFQVAKNKHKPFTVYSGVLATTALGTIFSVKRSHNKNTVTVKLFRGKVVVHSTENNLKGWDQDVYLLPGEQLKFNEQSAMLAVGKIDSINNNPVVAKIKTNNKADSANNQLMFSNTLLPEVMQKLSAYYNVTIKYDTLLIDTINFTGTISRKDSLPVILKAIGEMNDLEILKNNNDEYIISKHE